MGLSIYNIKKWTRMLTGNSIYHVNQDLGKAFQPGALAGYFNDMTLKVLKGDGNLENGIPFYEHSDGSHVQMPTTIFQYGLGAYDLWQLKGQEKYKEKATLCADWAVEHQQDNGAWNNFFFIYPDHPYSAMPQGEGASLLLRIHKETGDNRYFDAARKAIKYMLTDVSAGGVSKHDDGLIFLEYTHLPVVLNGWIFALFGLYDFSLVTGEKKKELEATIRTIVKMLPKFDCGYWSMYDADVRITSPFYHNLHIAQMDALYRITGNPVFSRMADKWRKERRRITNRSRAFIKKAMQKVLEK